MAKEGELVINDPSLLVSAFVGIFLPLVVSAILASEARPSFKAIMAFLACLVATGLTMLFSHQLINRVGVAGWDLIKLVFENLMLVCVAAWTTYNNIWRPTGVVAGLERSAGQLGGNPGR